MTKGKLLLAGVLSAIAVLAVAAIGLAATQAENYKLSSSLNRGQEVPKPNAPKGAHGKFTGTLVEKGKGAKLTWKLTFSGLSGKAAAAHIHLGKRGKAGPVAVPLCGPCRSGVHGKTTVTSKIEAAIESGKAYVNVHTAKNAAGEIRGQIKSTES
jgi:hypothetical protein